MAASSATGAATIACNIAAQNRVTSKTYLVKNTPCFNTSATRCRKQLVLRSSTDESATVATEDALKTSVEVPKGPPSLISALNVEKALRGIAITDEDHYGRLGLQSKCSYDQVTSAYKIKVAETMNQGLAEDELSNQLELLKESHTILSTEAERRLYDWSLARKEKPDRYMWPHEVDITQVQFPGKATGQEPEDVGPTRLVGYFVLSWLALSVVLSIALNR